MSIRVSYIIIGATALSDSVRYVKVNLGAIATGAKILPLQCNL